MIKAWTLLFRAVGAPVSGFSLCRFHSSQSYHTLQRRLTWQLWLPILRILRICRPDHTSGDLLLDEPIAIASNNNNDIYNDVNHENISQRLWLHTLFSQLTRCCRVASVTSCTAVDFSSVILAIVFVARTLTILRQIWRKSWMTDRRTKIIRDRPANFWVNIADL